MFVREKKPTISDKYVGICAPIDITVLSPIHQSTCSNAYRVCHPKAIASSTTVNHDRL